MKLCMGSPETFAHSLLGEGTGALETGWDSGRQFFRPSAPGECPEGGQVGHTEAGGVERHLD